MCVHVYLCLANVQCPHRPEEGTRSFGARVTVMMRYGTQVLRIKLVSPPRAVSTLNC